MRLQLQFLGWTRIRHGRLHVDFVRDLHGEAGRVAGDCSEAVKDAFSYMRCMVTAGWSIYPLGYYYRDLLGAVIETIMNVVYNVDDFVNEIAFRLRAGLWPRQSPRKGRSCWKAPSSSKHCLRPFWSLLLSKSDDFHHSSMEIRGRWLLL